MAHRATKSGINRDIQSKLASKYDEQLASQCLLWISHQIQETFDSSGDARNVHEHLKSGHRLARLANSIQGGRIKSAAISKAKFPFQQMELINIFVEFCKDMGVPDQECFATVDLYEAQNMNQVIICIAALMRKFGLGPKEATENRRQFTEEQLNAGSSIIGLQMGTNRGASQSGMSFGKTRSLFAFMSTQSVYYASTYSIHLYLPVSIYLHLNRPVHLANLYRALQCQVSVQFLYLATCS
ncbi:Chd64 [Bugula neritina]|uniref:Transgelin n=1 Tax=Bugula neritina TaxID=10212 RepID=A0A7J7JGF4_BUGNE|nr:Chd64 [Bugula neritina]